MKREITGVLFIFCLCVTNNAIAQTNGPAPLDDVSYKANQLSGMDLPIKAVTKTDPFPVLFRISVPGATGKGCFVVGEAKANPSTLRADVEIVSLSCLDKDGKATKDVAAEGYVLAPDGKRGLKGRVYANNYFGGELLEVKPGEATVVVTSEGKAHK